MSAQHTPGQWAVSGFIVNSGAPNYTPVADCETDNEWMVANARLIAAAPELLAALKDIVDRLTLCAELGATAHEAFDSFYQNLASDAIAKATGSAA